MKTKEEIFGPGWPYIFDASKNFYTKEHTFQKADEYAEEYAKAFLIWTRNNKTYPMDAQTCLEAFKESLKK